MMNNSTTNGKRRTLYQNAPAFCESVVRSSKSPDGEHIWCYPDGQIALRGTYKDGKKQGESVYYYENGQVWFKENYKDGLEHGEFIEYYPDGEIYSTETYIDGELV